MKPAVVLTASAVVLVQTACAHASADSWPTGRWTTAAPAEVGLDAGGLAALDAKLASGAFGDADGVVVVRRGRIAYERTYAQDYDGRAGERARQPGPLSLQDPAGPYNYLNPWWHPYYRRGDLHTMQSVTKTVLSITIGVAVARGEFPDLDTPILKFFDEARVANLDARKRRITIRHLLTMTAGLEWREDLPFTDPANSAHQMEASFDWVQYTIDRPMQYEPGTVFHYSSGVAQLLAQVFERATGQDVEEYAARYLFAPLGIEQFHWKRTPAGQANTEGGLYLRPRDLAKLGLLLARTGPPWVDPDLLPTIEIAREILSLADDRADREIVRVARGTADRKPETIGFDVGYWGSDHFSLICDAMVMPRWHGCPLEQLDSLRSWGGALNGAALFPSAAAAAEYRGWYLSQAWAEAEGSPGEFQVIRVDRAA